MRRVWSANLTRVLGVGNFHLQKLPRCLLEPASHGEGRSLICLVIFLFCVSFISFYFFSCFQMMVVMKRAKWDGTTAGSKLTASIAKVHDELKVSHAKFFSRLEVVGW